jgi:uncharacterized membrane protein
MKKTTQPAKQIHKEKGFLALAGEALHVLGDDIIEGKDKVVEAASEKFAAVKKTINKITHKKAAPVKRTVKKAAKKIAAKKTATKKPVKKAAKKIARRG